MERKFIKPAGAFPQTPEGWRQYKSQLCAREEVVIDNEGRCKE